MTPSGRSTLAFLEKSVQNFNFLLVYIVLLIPFTFLSICRTTSQFFHFPLFPFLIYISGFKILVIPGRYVKYPMLFPPD